MTTRKAKADDRNYRLWVWPLVIRDRGRLNNSRSFRRYQAGITKPMYYTHAEITIGGVPLANTESISYTSRSMTYNGDHD